MNIPDEIPKVKQPGYIYLIRLVGISRECYKLGKTRNLKKRLREIQAYNNKRAILLAYGFSSDIDGDESFILNRFKNQCECGEYFNFDVLMLDRVLIGLKKCCIEVFTDLSYSGQPIVFQRLMPYYLDDFVDDDGYYTLNRREQNIVWGD